MEEERRKGGNRREEKGNKDKECLALNGGLEIHSGETNREKLEEG